jgi:hypothetical protein
MDYYYNNGDAIVKSMLNTTEVKELSDWVQDRAKKKGYRTNHTISCQECKIELVLDNKTSCMTCPLCGISTTSSCVTPYCKTHQPYKRTSRLKECLMRAQSKQQSDISQDMIDRIKTHAYPIYTYTTVRASLKKLKLSKYYEDINYIIYKITNINPFKITQKEEDVLHSYFTKILSVWPLFKPSGRRSIISYPFIIRKLMQQITTPERYRELNLDYFSLPQLDKLIEYETLYKKIVKHNNWKTTSVLI